MILLEHVSKRFAPAAAAAVDDVSLTVPEGSTVALIGPSGCGKTTTMRMINRLIEPSSGRIVVAGQDVAAIDPVKLRRRIGYVIQQVGLFPHMTIADNIATAPRLLGWPPARITSRIEELLNLIGLDPAIYAGRYPRQLSGGQRQRVGVARALAADPPVLLMDEPFGAIDPIARTRLQDEIKEILRRVRKTVVMVTHDLDEAMKMGDRIAIMRDGRLVQYDTPDAVLAAPADAFVESFVGPDRALKRLGLLQVQDIMNPVDGAAGATIGATASAREALARLIALNAETLTVVDGNGRPVGAISRARLFEAGSRPLRPREE
jgi:osmoprotectant transport system ATP-binding protein